VKPLINKLALFCALVALGLNSAKADSFQNVIEAYYMGDWTFGCFMYDYANLGYAFPHMYMNSRCYVYPPSTSNVISFGVHFNADGWSHYTGEDEFYDEVEANATWPFGGSGSHTTWIYPVVSHDTYGILYWSQLCHFYWFWYQNIDGYFGAATNNVCEWNKSI
jgi:hypothetical protein